MTILPSSVCHQHTFNSVLIRTKQGPLCSIATISFLFFFFFVYSSTSTLFPLCFSSTLIKQRNSLRFFFSINNNLSTVFTPVKGPRKTRSVVPEKKKERNEFRRGPAEPGAPLSGSRERKIKFELTSTPGGKKKEGCLFFRISFSYLVTLRDRRVRSISPSSHILFFFFSGDKILLLNSFFTRRTF